MRSPFGKFIPRGVGPFEVRYLAQKEFAPLAFARYSGEPGQNLELLKKAIASRGVIGFNDKKSGVAFVNESVNYTASADGVHEALHLYAHGLYSQYFGTGSADEGVVSYLNTRLAAELPAEAQKQRAYGLETEVVGALAERFDPRKSTELLAAAFLAGRAPEFVRAANLTLDGTERPKAGGTLGRWFGLLRKADQARDDGNLGRWGELLRQAIALVRARQ